MRTTLDIADDVLFAAKNVARRDKKTVGTVVSELARKALQNADFAPLHLPTGEVLSDTEATARLRAMGIVPFRPPQGQAVTNEMINALREQEGI